MNWKICANQICDCSLCGSKKEHPQMVIFKAMEKPCQLVTICDKCIEGFVQLVKEGKSKQG